MSTELTPNEKQLLAREVAANDYDRQWPLRTTMGNTAREGFISGWDAAMEYVKGRSNAEVEKWRRYAKDLEHDMEASEKHCAQFHS